MRAHLRRQRGSGLLTAMIAVTIILTVTAGILYYSNSENTRSINISRGVPRNYCVEAGLQLARAYYGKNRASWTSFLASPSIYNPVGSSCLTSKSLATADPTNTTFQGAHPELFADLDADGKNDVYIYIRDNEDELPPALPDCTRDNDAQVIVGAVCISSTLAPRLQNGNADPAQMTSEAVVQYNDQASNTAQRCGSMGNCNANSK
jgi:hypothetical protein